MFSRKLGARGGSYVEVVTVLVVSIAAALAGALWNARWDLTRDRQFTLAPATLRTLGGLPGNVTVRVVMSKGLPSGFASARDRVTDFLREFEARSGGRLNLVFENPDGDSLARVRALSLGIEEVALQEQTRRGLQAHKGFFGLALIHGDRKEYFPRIESIETFEYDLTVRLKRLVTPVKTIGVVEGSAGNRFTMVAPGEPAPAPGFTAHFSGLQQKIAPLYSLETQALADSGPGARVDLLIVAAPSRLNEIEKYRIDQFLMAGKPVIFLAPGTNIDLSAGIEVLGMDNGYGGLLDHYGAGVGNRLILEPRNWERVRFGNSEVALPYPYWLSIPYATLNADNPVTASLQALSFPWTTSLELKPGAQPAARFEVLVATSEEAWQDTGLSSLYPRDLREYVPVSPHSFPLAVLGNGPMTSYFSAPPAGLPPGEARAFRPRSQESVRLLVVANALFASDFYTGYIDAPGNLHFLLNAVDQLALDPDLIQVRSRQLAEAPLEEESTARLKTPILWANMGLGPLLLLALGVSLRARAKRRESRV